MSGGEISHLEPWLDMEQLAQQLSCSTRWLKYRLADGMPSAVIAGRRKFKQSETEQWLEEHGHLRREGEAA